MKLNELAKKVKLTYESGANLDYDKQDDWQQQANSYRCTLHYQKRKFSFDYWMGTACVNGPEMPDVLESLLSDTQAGEQDFEDFCSEFGYDIDSRKAEKTWKACKKQAVKMRKLLGNDFETFMSAER